jgi:hypothetical protein
MQNKTNKITLNNDVVIDREWNDLQEINSNVVIGNMNDINKKL